MGNVDCSNWRGGGKSNKSRACSKTHPQSELTVDGGEGMSPENAKFDSSEEKIRAHLGQNYRCNCAGK